MTEKSIISLDDMITLLEVNDAVDELSSLLETIVGDITSSGLMRELEKITDLIVKISPVYIPAGGLYGCEQHTE